MLKENSAFLAPHQRFEGFFHDIIKQLSKLIGVSFQIRLSRDGLKGEIIEDERYLSKNVKKDNFKKDRRLEDRKGVDFKMHSTDGFNDEKATEWAGSVGEVLREVIVFI